MLKTFHVLITIAIVLSCVSTAYYISEYILGMTDTGYNYYILSKDSRFSDYRFSNMIKFLVYWVIGFIGFCVSTRMVSIEKHFNIALIISFSYLMVIGAHGGLTFGGQYILRICLSLINVVLFCILYNVAQSKFKDISHKKVEVEIEK